MFFHCITVNIAFIMIEVTRFRKNCDFQDDTGSLNKKFFHNHFLVPCFFSKLKQSDTEFFALELLLQVTYCVLTDVAQHSRAHFQLAGE